MKNAKAVDVKSGARDEAEGAGKRLVGKVESGAGKVLRSPKLEARGNRMQAEGIVQTKVGQIKKVLGS
jgi:uncharacterized protein YjbJ (UPF0337 family)